jgi:vacuolar-type H+-ATPase subunit I/STV1
MNIILLSIIIGTASLIIGCVVGELQYRKNKKK